MTNNVPFVASGVLNRVCEVASQKMNSKLSLDDVGLITVEEKTTWKTFTEGDKKKARQVREKYFIVQNMALEPLASVSIEEYQSSLRAKGKSEK